MAGPRARYQGSAKDLAALLQPLVQPLGRSWLKYCEVDHAQAAKVEVENITASHSLLAVLHSQQANLSYPRKLVEQVVRLVYDQNSSEVAWSCRSEDLEPYIATMTARVVNLCRAVGQSERKHPKCSWVKALPWHQDTTKGSEGAVAASSVDDPTTYIYGWDTSLCMAWRCPRTVQGKSSRQKCLATAIKIPETATGSDPPIAYFPDGTTWEISDITCDEYASLCPSTRSKSDSLWQGTHCVSQHSLKICPKSDRTPLYVLCEQRRQVLQIQLRKCSSPETALQIIQKVAESFASNSIQREDLITERDRLMTEMGMTVPAKTIKKPAVKGQIKKTPAANQEPEKMQPSTEELQAMDGNEWFHLPSPPSSDDDWYKDLLHEDGSHPDLGFTVSRAHFRNGEVLMVAGSTVTLSKLTELLIHHSPWRGEGEHLFIVDTSGLMVASSRGRPAVLCEVPSCKQIQALWNQSHSAEVHEAVGYLMGMTGGNLNQIEELGIHETEAGHIFSWVPLRSGPQRFGLSWIVVYVQTVTHYKGNVSMVLERSKADIGDLNTDLETEMAHARLWTIGGCLLIMLVGATSLACIAWQVTRPLKLIAKDMNAVAKLELDRVDDLLQDAAEKGGSSMIHEVAQIRDSFVDMTSGLRSFSRYMDPYVVQVLLQSQRQAQLGVARADVTIFFSDIADFTTITENVPPPVFLDMLGEYLDRMSGIIMKHHGVVGEFIGDGIMAWWNVPCDLGERHTKAALHAALEQQQVLSELRPAWCERGLPEVRARMGLVRGQVYAGNIGSKNRMKFGLVGDKVNLASRLEALCKRYSVQTLVDSEAYNAPDVEREFFLRPIDVVVVKGRSETTELFELVAHKSSVMGTSLQAMYERFCQDFAQIHAHYRQREFSKALDMLREYLVLWPGDRPAQIMKQRCEALVESPPPDGWSHVEKLSDK